MMSKQRSTQPGVAASPGPGRKVDSQGRTVQSRPRFIAPSLASAMVLLAAIGLSRELLVHESPTAHFIQARQRAAGELLKSPDTDLSISQFDDGYIHSENLVVADKPRTVLSEAPDESFDYRGDDAPLLAADQGNIDGKEVDRLQPSGTRDISESAAHKMETSGGAGVYADTAFDFLEHYRQTQNLHFQQASGYWANSYIPGDPEIRLLSARLVQWDRSWLENNAVLEQDVEPVKQPFDAPADNALALSLMADANGVSANDASQGPTRMRLQVGICGIEHRRGQRPAMNVGVVVDLPADAPDKVRIATRALLDAMLQSKQAGDHFSLVMTSQQGDVQNRGSRSLVIPAKDFRFGSLQLARQLILGRDSLPVDDGREPLRLSLYQAVERAGAMLKQTDDPSRPLGSQPQNSTVEKLVLAGLGNRRYLEAPGQAR